MTFKRATFSLGAIMAFRMIGLFMILPVFSLYAGKIPGATETLIGIAIGIYGLTQACLQLPFGALSDRLGRKPIIALGLILFITGSIIAGLSHNITGILIGRALQGAGAVGSTCLALLADLTRDEHRTSAMAIMGMLIGVSFLIAIIVGPWVAAHFHLNGIFWLTALLGLAGFIILFALVPKPPTFISHTERKPFIAMLKNAELLRLDVGIFVQHATLTLMFLALPLMLVKQLHFQHMSLLYFIVLVASFIAMVPLIIIGEKKRRLKNVFLLAIALLIAGLLLLSTVHHQVIWIGVWLFFFFTGFTLLESTLPSLISKIAPIKAKGAAMGIYSTAQFFGIFIGGSFGGLLLSHISPEHVLLIAAAACLAWWLVAAYMKQPPYLSTLIFAEHQLSQKKLDILKQQPGVHDISWQPEEQLLYIKIDKQITSKTTVQQHLLQR